MIIGMFGWDRLAAMKRCGGFLKGAVPVMTDSFQIDYIS